MAQQVEMAAAVDDVPPRCRHAQRQRGIAVLADTGRQIEVSLRLPVLAETGII